MCDKTNYTKVWMTAIICTTIWLCLAAMACTFQEVTAYNKGLCRQQKLGSNETFLGACK